MERDGVIEILQRHWPDLAERYGIASLSLFGSMARETASQESDVNLLVAFDRPVGLFGLFALQDRLEMLLGRPVDLGTRESLKPRIRSRVLAEAIDVNQTVD